MDERKHLLHDPSPSLIEEFHKVARHFLRRDPARREMVTEDLVHTSLSRLYQIGQEEGLTRGETIGRFARVVRQALVDKARRRNSVKRGEGRRPEQLVEGFEPHSGLDSMRTLEVDDALEALEQLDERQALVVELRYFLGLTDAEVADALECSVKTVYNTWRTAKAWLLERFQSDG